MPDAVPTITPLEPPRFTNGRHSLMMTQLFTTARGVKLRIDIKCASVDHRSYAHASAFEPVKPEWTQIASVPFRDLAVVRSRVDPSRPADDHARSAFARDTAELLRVLELLFG